MIGLCRNDVAVATTEDYVVSLRAGHRLKSTPMVAVPLVLAHDPEHVHGIHNMPRARPPSRGVHSILQEICILS